MVVVGFRGLFVRSQGEPGRSRDEPGMTGFCGCAPFVRRPGIAQRISPSVVPENAKHLSGILKTCSGGCVWLRGLFTSSRGKPGMTVKV